MNLTRLNSICLAILLTCLLPESATSEEYKIPSILPDPDGKPGDSTKPVKVYILAGQSNMVGMGNLSGAKNMYSGIYFSSNPYTPNSPFQIYQVGHFKAAPLRILLPNGRPTKKTVANGSFEVPLYGEYEFQCGFGDNSYAEMKLNGKQVYLREKGEPAKKEAVKLIPGNRYSFSISGFKGDAPHFWIEKKDLLGNGDLEAVAKREGKFPWLVDSDGNWTVRQDVYFQEARLAKDGKGSSLSPSSNNGRSIGPELGFGHVMGTYHDEQVLLIKTAQGNRSLGFDFRPPSSGRTDPDNNFESGEYKLMIEGVRKTLEDIDKVVPGYKGQGYEISGFAWFQGHKDSFSEPGITEYEKHLVNLINDVRKEFNKPKLPVVVATVGFGGNNMQEKFQRILKAQLAVSDFNRHPEYKGNVASVDTRNFWREIEESPKSEDYHYNRNAETYMLIGDAIGRAMVAMQGGESEPVPQGPRSQSKASFKLTELSELEKELAQDAIKPVVIDGIINSYVNNPKYAKTLIAEANCERPQRRSQFLRGAIYGLENCYRTIDMNDFDWQPFGPNLNEIQWDYLSFDPKEALPLDKGNRYRPVTYPDGAQEWSSPSFEANHPDWKKGFQPFGQLDGNLIPLNESCTADFCGCSITPKSLWEKEVLLMRGQVELPPFKQGHRYRIVVGGAAHVNSGEGFAIYLNGKLLTESDRGVAVRQGGQPRGTHIYADVKDEFAGGKVTIAAKSFLRYNHPRRGVQPPRGHFWLRIEEQKIPPVLLNN